MSGKLENHCANLSQHSGMLLRNASLNLYWEGLVRENRLAYPLGCGYLNSVGNDSVKEGVCNGGVDLLVKRLLVRSSGYLS